MNLYPENDDGLVVLQTPHGTAQFDGNVWQYENERTQRTYSEIIEGATAMYQKPAYDPSPQLTKGLLVSSLTGFEVVSVPKPPELPDGAIP